MRKTEIIMGMTVTVEVGDEKVKEEDLSKIFDYFRYIDDTFSVYKETSEISRINRHEIPKQNWSKDMKSIFQLAEKTKSETDGFFDIWTGKMYDPSGLVKGWAINNAANLLKGMGFSNYYVDAGGDVEVSGKNERGETWSVGIKNPFNTGQIVKIIFLETGGVATSGTYIRGQHIYNPKNRDEEITDIVSLTVIGPNVFEADRFATAAFAMGRKGIAFIENLDGFEGYMIDGNGVGTSTSGFDQYLAKKEK